MAYSRRRRTASRSGSNRRGYNGSGRSSRIRRSSSARPASRRASTSRRSGGQTVRLVIEHAAAGPQSVSPMTAAQSEKPKKGSVF